MNSKSIFFYSYIFLISSCTQSAPEREASQPRQKGVMELIDDHNLEMIEDQYRIRVNSKEIESYLENIKFDDMYKSWFNDFLYLVNEDYKTQTAELIKTEKEKLQKFKAQAAEILANTDSTELATLGRLQETNELINTLEARILEAEESLNKPR